MENEITLETLQSKIAEQEQYMIGAFDAVARLLATMAKHQGLPMNESQMELGGILNIYEPTTEEDKALGYGNVIGLFYNSFNPPDQSS